MKSLASVLVLLAATPCLADYSPPSLFDMVGSSDLVLVGTISEVGKTTFVLDIETVVAGEPGAKQITVKRYQDWECSSRWIEYAEKQRVLLCLTTKAGEAAKIRSGGGEGEMPVDAGMLHYRGFPIDTIAAAGPQTIAGKTVHGQVVKLETFVAAVQGFRRCFSVKLMEGPYERLGSVTQTASDAEVKSFAESSPVAAFLAKTARGSHVFKKPTASSPKAVADAKAKELGYDVEALLPAAFDADNTKWKAYRATLKEPPPGAKAIEGRSFWAVYYGPKNPKQRGGDLWVFVDRETHQVLAALRGR